MKVHSASSRHSPFPRGINQEKISRRQKGRNLMCGSPTSPHTTSALCRPFQGCGLHMVSETVCSNLQFGISHQHLLCVLLHLSMSFSLILKAIYKARFRCKVILKQQSENMGSTEHLIWLCKNPRNDGGG